MTRDATSRDNDYNRVYGLDATIRFPGNIDWSTMASVARARDVRAASRRFEPP